MKKYVAYYRVSSKEQGNSGLGLSAQENAIASFIKQSGGEIIERFKEVESAAKVERIKFGQNINLNVLLSKRPVFLKAVHYAKENGAILLVKEISRLTRVKLLYEYLKRTGVEFICTDYPNEGQQMLGFRIEFAEHEAREISRRTSAALQAKVKRDGKWQLKAGEKTSTGKVACPAFADGRACKASAESKKKAAAMNENNIRALQLIHSMMGQNKSYAEMAATLTSSKFLTPNGKMFSPSHVRQLYLRDLYSKIKA